MWEFANKHEFITFFLVVGCMIFVYKTLKVFIERNKPSTKCINYEEHEDLSDRE